MGKHTNHRRRTIVALFASDRRGAVAVIFAASLPVLGAAAFGGMDVLEAVRSKTVMQAASDAAALQGAKQLAFDQSDATAQRTIQSANAQLSDLKNWTATVNATSDISAGSMNVQIDATRASFLGRFLMPSGWHVQVSSTAVMNARRPLCVLASAAAGASVLHLQDRSVMTSPSCLIQSDSDIVVDAGAQLVAADARAVTSAKGSIQPAALTDAPPVADPFAGMNLTPPASCTDNDKLQFSVGTQSLNAGTHCGNVHLSGTAVLMLNPGEHYFVKGNFHVTDTAQITGSDVVLIFKPGYKLKFDKSATMSLDGRTTGAFAGFVIVTTRDYKNQFEIATNQAKRLLGTIYLPAATLSVTGENTKVADQSPWTVVIANKIVVDGSANLVVNANYSGSNVPVPPGVGSNLRSARLSK